MPGAIKAGIQGARRRHIGGMASFHFVEQSVIKWELCSHTLKNFERRSVKLSEKLKGF